MLPPTEPTNAPETIKASLKVAKGAVYRQHILDVAERAFARHGYAQTKMQHIAGQAGISLATLYQSYAGKRELHRAVLLARDHDMMGAVVQQVAIAQRQSWSVWSLLQVMHSHVSYLLTHPDYLHLILQEGHAWYHLAAQPTDDEQALWNQGLKIMSAVFEQGIRNGELVPGEPAELARVLMALQQARLANWVAAGMEQSHDQVIGAIQADFVRQFCRPALAENLLDNSGAGFKPAAVAEIAVSTPQ